MSQISAHSQTTPVSQDSVIMTDSMRVLVNRTSILESQHSDIPEEVEQNNTSRVNLGRTPWYCRKIIWISCASFLVITWAIIVPILIMVVFPHILQSFLDKSRLELTSMNIHTPMTNTSLNITPEGKLMNAGSLGTSISFDVPIDIYCANNLIGNISFPALHIFNGEANLSSTSTLMINDETRFGGFISNQLNNRSFSLSLVGKVSVSAFRLTKKGLSFNKTITISGGSSQILTIQNYKVNIKNLTQEITAVFTNPFPLSAPLGTVGYRISYNKTFMGLVQADNITIVEGTNTFILKGPLNPKLTHGEMKNFTDALAKTESGGSIIITAVYDFVKPDGVNTVSWLQQWFQNFVFRVPVTKTVQTYNQTTANN